MIYIQNSRHLMSTLLTASLLCFSASGIYADTVLILNDTVAGGSSSLEAQAAANLGFNVEVATAAQWQAKSQSQFATYRALILGDPNCGMPSAIGAAANNRQIWS